MSREKVILVDENDNQVGLMPKLEAHQKGLLHRAFSVFIFNSNYKLLLQKRATSKYHSGGLWTNTCCSHPRDGEKTEDAANRRLLEEMGIKTDLRKVYDFIYKAELDNELTENEFDHVYYGVYNEDPILNLDEAEDFKWIDMETLNDDIIKNGDIKVIKDKGMPYNSRCETYGDLIIKFNVNFPDSLNSDCFGILRECLPESQFNNIEDDSYERCRLYNFCFQIVLYTSSSAGLNNSVGLIIFHD